MLHRVSSPSGDESDDPMQATLESNEWPYWLPTSAQRKWHSELITRILEAVPQLKELCIVLCTVKFWYKHYRGTKTDSIVTVCQKELCFPETPAQFPYGFADIDWSC